MQPCFDDTTRTSLTSDYELRPNPEQARQHQQELAELRRAMAERVAVQVEAKVAESRREWDVHHQEVLTSHAVLVGRLRSELVMANMDAAHGQVGKLIIRTTLSGGIVAT